MQPEDIQTPSTTLPMLAIEDFRGLLDEYLDDYFSHSKTAAAQAAPHYERLVVNLHGLYAAGGKRVRPYLAYLSYRLFGGTELRTVLPLAATIELLHMAMLVHDDIIDRDTIRHGQPNLTGRYQQQYGDVAPDKQIHDHYAMSASILGGDFLLSEAYRLIGGMPAGSPTQKLALVELFGQTVFEETGGELLDTEAVLYPLHEADPQTISSLKTASYTGRLPLKAGAILAGAPHKTLDALTAIGTDIGIAFQMADDEIGVFGDEKLTGKTASSDLYEAKRTLLLQLTYRRASRADQKILDDIVGNQNAGVAELDTVRNIIQASGALAEHQAQRGEFTDRALQQISSLTTAASVGPLVQLIQQLTERQY
jgi:geranylgeranyl pyrophosphate synthase